MRILELVLVHPFWEFPLETVQHCGDHELAHSLDECFTNTNALASEEWREAVSIALVSTRGQVVLAV